MFKQILIAHDLSHEADIALRRALQIARQHGARLSLVHVLEEHLPSAMHSNLRSTAQQHFEERLKQLDAPECRILLRRGHPVQQILEEINDSQTDLLVIGQHHHKSPELFIGTTLERIARHMSAPLLLVVDEPANQPYRQAAVALDFSLCACDALRKSCALLPPQASLLALNVMEPNSRERDIDLLATQKTLLEKLLEDELANLAGQAIPGLELEVVYGSLPKTLEDTLAERQPQLLAVGSHSRSLITQALLGSLALRYLQSPPCDLLLVR